MTRRLHLILILFAFAMAAQAQDTLTVMQYNLLYYGNYNSGFADCYETNNNTQRKDECIRTIVNHVRPDIFTVCEFGSTQTLQNDFLRHNLNINGVDYWKSDNIINYAGEYIINHIFYDSRKMGLKKHVALRTNPRDTDVYELYLKTKSLSAGDTIKLVCIVAHPKAGQGYEASRRAQMQVAMDYVNQHYSTDNVLIMGDFNMYGASESGYRLLTQTYSNPYARFIDPTASLNSTPSRPMAIPTSVSHQVASMTASISSLCRTKSCSVTTTCATCPTPIVPWATTDATSTKASTKATTTPYRPMWPMPFSMPDHLPVTMKIAVDTKLGVNDFDLPQYAASIAPNPTSGLANVHFQNPTEGLVRFEVVSLQGQRIVSQSAFFDSGEHDFGLGLDDVAPGFYLLRLANERQTLATLKLIVK